MRWLAHNNLIITLGRIKYQKNTNLFAHLRNALYVCPAKKERLRVS